MLDGADNGLFGTIKTHLENKMTCGLYSYPKTKDETEGLLDKYHVGKKLARDTPVKEEFTSHRQAAKSRQTRPIRRGNWTVSIAVNQITGPKSFHNCIRRIDQS